MNAPQFPKDALMYPNINDQIDKFMKKNGDIAKMISYLSESYQGNFHIIDAFGIVLKSLGVDFHKMFESFLKEQIIRSFDPRIVDLKFDPENPPAWTETLASNNFWVSLVSKLLSKYPKSRFLLFSYESICQTSPQSIAFIPPFNLSLNSFEKVVAAQILSLQSQNFNYHNSIKRLLSMLTADDMIIVYTASKLDRNKNVPIIRAIEDHLQKRRPSLNTFLTSLMRFEGLNDETISILHGHKPLDFQTITELCIIGIHSNFLQDFALRRMVKDIFNDSFDSEYHKFLLQSLITLTKTQVDSTYFFEGINLFSKWDFKDKNKIALGLYIAKVKFCAIAMIPIIKSRILDLNPRFFSDKVVPSVERLMLCEIAYWHREFIPKIYHIVEKGIENSSNRTDLDSTDVHKMLAEFYEIAVFLFNLGSYRNVLGLLVKPLSKIDNDLKRKSLMKMMQNAMPPYSKDFLSQMLKCLTNPFINSLFFPSKGRQALPIEVTALEVLWRFTDRINKDSKSMSNANEAPLYDQLRMSAAQKISIARGEKQLKVSGYF